MNVLRYLVILGTGLILSGCSPAFNKTLVKPEGMKPITRFVTVFEYPVLIIPDFKKSLKDKWKYELTKVRKQIAMAVGSKWPKVAKANGLTTRTMLLKEKTEKFPEPIKMLTQYNLRGWDYMLHVLPSRGHVSCDYRYGTCFGHYQSQLVMTEVKSGKVIWKVVDDGGTFYGNKAWNNGLVFKNILTHMAKDGLIRLPSSEPIIDN